MDSRLVGAWRFVGFTLLAGSPAPDAGEEAWQVLPSGKPPALALGLVYGADGSARLEYGRGAVERPAGEPACGGPAPGGRFWLHPDGRRLLIPVSDPGGSESGFAFLFVRETATPGAGR